MLRRRTSRTFVHQVGVRSSNCVIDAAFWLLPLLWVTSSTCLAIDIFGGPVEAGHTALWLALAGVGVNSHVLARHVVGRLTEIIALWQEDVHVRVPSARKVRAVSNQGEENVVVPILRTLVTHRTGTEDGPN